MKKIYSILVAYNPDLEELNQAVERLKKQTGIVIVCNNSDYDVEFEGEQVKVFNFGENLGIAKAQSIGMKWAFENGADFILVITLVIASNFMWYFVPPEDFDLSTLKHTQKI